MLFQTRFHEPIRRGEITSTVRIWHRPRVRVNGRYALGSGAIVVDRIQEIEFEALTPSLARRSGFPSLVDLIKIAKHGAGERVFLIDFHYVDAPARAPTETSAAQRESRRRLRSSTPWIDVLRVRGRAVC